MNTCDLFLAVLVYIQEQQNCSYKTWHIHMKIVSNGSSKISLVSVSVKGIRFLHYVLVSWFSGKVWKTAAWKMKKGSYFPNQNMLNWTLSIPVLLVFS